MRLGVLLGLAGALLIGAAHPAAAHTDLVSSSPADGSALRVAPSSFTLTFSEAVSLDLAAFALEIARQRIPNDRATILTPATPVGVEADPERIRQVLDHLIANALKFSAAGSGIMVSVSTDDEFAQVDVKDHGVGLSADDHEILFSRYGRIRDTRTANVPGIGLGLYLSKLIAIAHGGNILAASPGRGLGATFTLRLPLSGRPHRPAPDVPASSFWE